MFTIQPGQTFSSLDIQKERKSVAIAFDFQAIKKQYYTYIRLKSI